MLVKATAKGFFGHFREVGAEFEVPAGSKASWYEPVEGDAAVDKPAKRGQGGRTPGAGGDADVI